MKDTGPQDTAPPGDPRVWGGGECRGRWAPVQAEVSKGR